MGVDSRRDRRPCDLGTAGHPGGPGRFELGDYPRGSIRPASICPGGRVAERPRGARRGDFSSEMVGKWPQTPTARGRCGWVAGAARRAQIPSARSFRWVKGDGPGDVRPGLAEVHHEGRDEGLALNLLASARKALETGGHDRPGCSSGAATGEEPGAQGRGGLTTLALPAARTEGPTCAPTQRAGRRGPWRAEFPRARTRPVPPAPVFARACGTRRAVAWPRLGPRRPGPGPRLSEDHGPRRRALGQGPRTEAGVLLRVDEPPSPTLPGATLFPPAAAALLRRRGHPWLPSRYFPAQTERPIGVGAP